MTLSNPRETALPLGRRSEGGDVYVVLSHPVLVPGVNFPIPVEWPREPAEFVFVCPGGYSRPPDHAEEDYSTGDDDEGRVLVIRRDGSILFDGVAIADDDRIWKGLLVNLRPAVNGGSRFGTRFGTRPEATAPRSLIVIESGRPDTPTGRPRSIYFQRGKTDAPSLLVLHHDSVDTGRWKEGSVGERVYRALLDWLGLPDLCKVCNGTGLKE